MVSVQSTYKLPNMPPLCKEGVIEALSFAGLGYFTLLYIKQYANGVDQPVDKKNLFTCMVVRSVHLELVEDMSTEEFL